MQIFIVLRRTFLPLETFLWCLSPDTVTEESQVFCQKLATIRRDLLLWCVFFKLHLEYLKASERQSWCTFWRESSSCAAWTTLRSSVQDAFIVSLRGFCCDNGPSKSSNLKKLPSRNISSSWMLWKSEYATSHILGLCATFHCRWALVNLAAEESSLCNFAGCLETYAKDRQEKERRAEAHVFAIEVWSDCLYIQPHYAIRHQKYTIRFWEY